MNMSLIVLVPLVSMAVALVIVLGTTLGVEALRERRPRRGVRILD